jgi:tetratricopeptide (TPR) repeat protein
MRAEGIQQYHQGRHIESMATLRHTLEIAPSDAEANYYMGMHYRRKAAEKLEAEDVPTACKHLDTAVRYFTQALKTWPNYMAAVDAKNEALELRGKFDQALDVAERVATNNRDVADHYVYLGNEYRERADFDNALAAYNKALAFEPGYSKAYAGLGKMYEQIGDRSKAIYAYEQAYRANAAEPGVAAALQRLGQGGGEYSAQSDASEW